MFDYFLPILDAESLPFYPLVLKLVVYPLVLKLVFHSYNCAAVQRRSGKRIFTLRSLH